MEQRIRAKPRDRQRDLPLYCLCLVAFASSGGCGRQASSPEMVKVTGTVKKADGKPLTHGEIVFVPKEGSATANTAGGDIDKQGRFELTTFVKGDGCVPDTYKVAINIWGMVIPSPKSPGPFEIPLRYVNSRTSDLEVQVLSGSGTLEVDLQLDN